MADTFRSPIAEPYADESFAKKIIKLATKCKC